MIDPDKYIVTNRAGEVIPDAVVIRLQDTFAPAVLGMYMHQIELVLNLAPDMDKATRKNLTELSYYFADLAMQASEKQSNKLPTL